MRVAVWAFVVALLAPPGAWAFGTINHLGQGAEHEHITTRALKCDGTLPARYCFEKGSLRELAGQRDVIAAVGAPDRPTRGLTNTPAAHCDGGDYLDIAGYEHSETVARAALQACRDWMDLHLNNAVDAAGAIVKNGEIDDSQIPTIIPCVYDNRPGRAKCNALEQFGLTLHASQDFYSHSNWTDRPPPGVNDPILHPPGLGNSGRAPWLDLRLSAPPFPKGLITGCFIIKRLDVTGVLGCGRRVTHFVLNKDTGPVSPSIGIGTSTRGAAQDNFSRAVLAAIDDTQDKWAIFRERLEAKYGPQTADLIVCGLTHDHPATACAPPP